MTSVRSCSDHATSNAEQFAILETAEPVNNELCNRSGKVPAAFLYIFLQFSLMNLWWKLLRAEHAMFSIVILSVVSTTVIAVWATDIVSAGSRYQVDNAMNSYEILGTDGDDVIELTQSDQILWHGRSFGDVIFAGSGNDLIRDQNGSEDSSGNIVYGSDGDDRILAGYLGGDIIFAGKGEDFVSCQEAPCTAYGGEGNDELFGSEFPGSMLFGESGNDVIAAAVEGIIAFGGDGDDRMRAGETPSVLFGEAGNDVLDGAWGMDRLYGGDGDDIINGAGGSDYMSGGSGDDVLTGDDSEPAADLFVCGEGFDVITDFDPSYGDTKTEDCEQF
jgi:Ca2+-binding RTX toxin-like protein